MNSKNPTPLPSGNPNRPKEGGETAPDQGSNDELFSLQQGDIERYLDAAKAAYKNGGTNEALTYLKAILRFFPNNQAAEDLYKELNTKLNTDMALSADHELRLRIGSVMTKMNNDNPDNQKRSIFAIDPFELATLASDAWNSAAKDALNRGHAITGSHDGRVIRMYPDGRREDLGPVPQP